MNAREAWHHLILQASQDKHWRLTPKEAVQAQHLLAARVIRNDTDSPVQSVAGVDVGIHDGIARAAVVVFSYPTLEKPQICTAERKLSYPYIPGLLTFREAPAVLAALNCLDAPPDVILFDGQGIAHPRRLGLAAHLGVLLDTRSIGCAKSRLVGVHDEPEITRGSYVWLSDRGDTIGAVVRTRTNVRPVFVSIGHNLSLSSAIELVLGCCTRYRLPEPTRWAHRIASGKQREQ